MNTFQLRKLPRLQPIRYRSREEVQVVMDHLIENFINSNNDSTLNMFALDHIEGYSGFSRRALYYYIERLRKDITFNPKDNHSAINRAMSDKLELELVMEIEETYIKPGYYFNNRVLKYLAIAMWNKASPADKFLPVFKASNKWCRNFRRRHNYVWRKARALRRPRSNDKTRSIEKSFELQMELLCKSLKEKNQLNLLVNMDETSWRICYAGDMTWAKKGAQSVKIHVDHNVKTALTALASITATGDKLPLYILAKGKTQVAERKQVRGIEGFEYQTDRSKSGWTTTEVMMRYLKWLREIMNRDFNAEGMKIHLVLDTYSVHRCEQVKKEALTLNIDLHYIPSGHTEDFQPLDIRVFGALKAKARGYWYTNYALNPAEKYSMRSAVKTLLICWDQLTDKLISSSWEKYLTLIDAEENDDNVCTEPNIKGIEDTRSELIESIEQMKAKDPKIIQKILYDFKEDLEEAPDTVEDPEFDTDGGIEEEEDDNEDYDFHNHELIEDNENDESEIDTNAQIIHVISVDDLQELVDDPPKSYMFKDTEDLQEEESINPQTEESPEPLQHDSLTVTNIENEDLSFSDLENHIEYEETRKNDRVDNARSARKSPPRITETVGLSNMGATCAFNSFMQVIHLMPDVHDVLIDQKSDKTNLVKLVHYVLDLMTRSYESINMDYFLKSLTGIQDFDPANVLKLISSKNHSIIFFITHCIDPNMISFIKSGVYLRFLQIDVNAAFEHSLRGVEPSGLAKYLFIMTSKRTEGYKFPHQFTIADDRSSATLVLKAIVLNPQGHFSVLTRIQFTNNFLHCDDQCIKLYEPNKGYKRLQIFCMALYIVCKH